MKLLRPSGAYQVRMWMKSTYITPRWGLLGAYGHESDIMPHWGMYIEMDMAAISIKLLWRLPN